MRRLPWRETESLPKRQAPENCRGKCWAGRRPPVVHGRSPAGWTRRATNCPNSCPSVRPAPCDCSALRRQPRIICALAVFTSVVSRFVGLPSIYSGEWGPRVPLFFGLLKTTVARPTRRRAMRRHPGRANAESRSGAWRPTPHEGGESTRRLDPAAPPRQHTQ